MKISPRLASLLIIPLYRLWCSTLRYTESGRERVDAKDEARELMVYALWHNEVFPVMYLRRQLRVVAIVSRSNDGEYLARLLQALGIRTARGSSSRGGAAAMLEAARQMQEEQYNAFVTIDGPRGPRHEPKNGAIFLAHHAGAQIVPMRSFVKKAKIFRSWDRFRLPLPFCRVHVAFGEPYSLPPAQELTDEYLLQARQELKNRLDAMHPSHYLNEEGFLDD
jgi:Uncharacterized protein conserved in bacteria